MPLTASLLFREDVQGLVSKICWDALHNAWAFAFGMLWFESRTHIGKEFYHRVTSPSLRAVVLKLPNASIH